MTILRKKSAGLLNFSERTDAVKILTKDRFS